MDLIVRNAKLQRGKILDIGISESKIAALETDLTASAPLELDAKGQLVLPAFVNGQLHACKSFWRRLLTNLPDDIQALPRFEAAGHVKQLYTVDDVFARVDETMRLAIQNGTCAIRLFGDVDEDSGLNAVEALIAIREKYSPFMIVQVVAFPQDGFLNKGTQRLMTSALEMGADVVGGIPWIEPTVEAQHQHTDMCFELARRFDRALHFVCDDVVDPTVRSLEYVARQAVAYGWQGRVSATQCAALAAYDDEYAQLVIDLLRKAQIAIFCNSHVSLIASEFDPQQPWPRGITRVRELLKAGVAVASGQDDIDNWFYPFGRNDMLEVAQFMAHNGQFAWRGEVDQVLPMITTTPAQTLGLANYGLAVGHRANVVVLDAEDWHSAVQFQAAKRFVILNGKLAAAAERREKLYIE